MTRPPRSSRPAARVLRVAPLLVLLACGDRVATEESSPTAAAPPGMSTPMAERAIAPGFAGMKAVAQSDASALAPEVAPAPPVPSAQDVGQVAGQVLEQDAAPTMLIRTGQASVEVDSLEAAMAAVRALVAREGGVVANTSLAAGRDQVRSATLQLRVPAARFDALVGGLSPLGRLETVHVQAQDVGEEFTDVSARMANARRLEARLLALLERGAPRLQDVLAVERELARVREEIERTEGRLRYLRARTATSTLDVTVHEPPPLIGPSPSTNPLAEALRQAWRNFVALLAATIAAMGVLVPVAVLGAAAWWGARRWRKA